MKIFSSSHIRVSRLLAIPVLVLALAVAMIGSAGQEAQAQQAPIVIDWSMEVPGAGCSTKGADHTCDVEVGTTLTLQVRLNSFSGLPDVDNDTQAGYINMEVAVSHSANLTIKPRPGTDEIVWADCDRASALEFTQVAGVYSVFCAVSADESTFLGILAEVDYTCSSSVSSGNTLTLAQNVTRISDENISQLSLRRFDPDGPANEVLTVNCVAPSPIGGVGSFPDVEGSAPSETPASSGGNAGVVATLIAALTAGALALGGAAWYARRRWLA